MKINKINTQISKQKVINWAEPYNYSEAMLGGETQIDQVRKEKKPQTLKINAIQFYRSMKLLLLSFACLLQKDRKTN